MPVRIDGRRADELRTVKITPDYLRYAEGSALIEWGKNKVICAATLENRVPPYMIGTGSGWVTAEYSMLPRSAKQRIQRDSAKGAPNKRGIEIARLISRALRRAVDLKRLGERTILIDCDVIESDGGTRTASITGGFVALALAIKRLREDGQAQTGILQNYVAGVSVGMVEGQSVLDLCYLEDSQADTDMNVVMTDKGEFIEVQGTGENRNFTRAQLDEMLNLAASGITTLTEIQRQHCSLT